MKATTHDQHVEADKNARLITAEEFWKLGSENRHCELVRGGIVRMTPAGAEHGAIEVKLAAFLWNHLDSKKLGILTSGDTGHIISRDTVRAPDIGFVFKDNIPKEGLPKKFWEIPPDLAIEIISPSDTYEGVEEKVRDWLSAGTREVWVVNPRLKAVKLQQPGQPVREFGLEDTLESPLLKDFSVAVAEIFKF